MFWIALLCSSTKVTGMAGRPKQITGFQTRTTPVLLNFQDVIS